VPKIETAPLLRFTSEVMMPMMVVLPAPFGPSRPKKSPGATSKLTPLSAT
jgi:hypothetical protein